ncbi:CBS domain-containing protein [Ferrimonas balearica]|uniref:CBS domain-containing protein n=1 Tax=Ferrimonas balearica TaxID=44012 RepID=UPI001C99B226|nr:CBS domain-containing protein [Ferrimonas balearica]MBY5991127.1 CBS domain-containing protein [Ferrimonas balearica]
MESVKVIDYMERHPVKLTPATPLSSAVELLLEKGQLGAPVVDEENRLLGFISEQECLAKLLENSYHCDLTAKVSDVMRTDVLSVGPEDSVLSLAELMLGQKPKVYPVVEAERVIGIIDRSRVLKAIGTHLKVCFRHAV